MSVGLRQKKNRITHVITGLDTGGAETMLCRLLSKLKNDQFTQSVISLLDGGTLRSQIEKLDVAVFSLGMKQGVPSLSALWRLKNILIQLKPDLIQGWMYHGNLAASLASFLIRGDIGGKKIKVLWNIRQANNIFSQEKKSTELMIRFGARLSKHVDKVIYNSQAGKNCHVSIGYHSSNSIVIPNGFDVETFKPDKLAGKSLRLELGLPEDAILVGLMARFHPMKDHANFLNAAGKILKKRRDIYYLLAGRGVDSENRKLMQLIDANDLGSHVFLLGDRSDTPRITASLSVAVLSSWTESFPNVVGEAMSCSVPCVATDVGDVAALVGDVGKVVPANNSEILAVAIEEYIDAGLERIDRLGKASRERIITLYSLGKIVDQYQKLYSEILS